MTYQPQVTPEQLAELKHGFSLTPYRSKDSLMVEKLALDLEAARARIEWYESRQGTHYKGCWVGGYAHYEGALAEIERLNKAARVAYENWKDEQP